MKEDQEQSGGALVSSVSGVLTRNSSGLVRRGLVDLLKLSAESNASGVDSNQCESSRLAFDEEAYKKAKRFYNRGCTKQDNGDFGGAIIDFDHAIEIDPRIHRFYRGRGDAKQSKGDLDGAIADYTKAIEIDPRHAFAYNNRAAVKRMQGDLEGALADYDKAIETLPRYAEAYANRGAAKQSNGNLDGAIADYTRAIEIDPQGTDFYYSPSIAMAYAFRGLAYLCQARDAEAQQDFTKCLAIDASQEAWIERKAEEIRGKARALSARRTVDWIQSGNNTAVESNFSFGEDDIMDGALVGHELFKAGIRAQDAWSQKMEDLIGPGIRPYLPDIWESAVIEHEYQGHDVADLSEWKP